MAEQIGNSGQREETRLEALRGSLDELVQRIRDYCTEVDEDPRTILSIFAFGFGFGNLINKLRGQNIPNVQSLFSAEDDDPVLTGQELLDKWTWIKSHVTELRRDMLGATPMVAAFSKAESLFSLSRRQKEYRDAPILLVVSDGVPTDPVGAGPELVLACADRMRDQGIVIASCFVAPRDLTLNRTMYEAPMPDWSCGAHLMFDCASPISEFSAIVPNLKDNGWLIPSGARLFSQVNQSELLEEFVAAVVPSESQLASNGRAAVDSGCSDQVRVFVSYSHVDSKYVAETDSLLSYVRSLEREGVLFWWDRKISAGDLWDTEIKSQIAQADIALVLVSQWLLNSIYCREVEAREFVKLRKQNGLRIVPVLVSACDWRRVDWLEQTQVMPSEGRDIEQHMVRRGQRMAFYLDLLNGLRANAKAVRDQRSRKDNL
jgi:hypothetical protein